MPKFHIVSTWQVTQKSTLDVPTEEDVWHEMTQLDRPFPFRDEDVFVLDMRDVTIQTEE